MKSFMFIGNAIGCYQLSVQSFHLVVNTEKSCSCHPLSLPPREPFYWVPVHPSSISFLCFFLQTQSCKFHFSLWKKKVAYDVHYSIPCLLLLSIYTGDLSISYIEVSLILFQGCIVLHCVDVSWLLKNFAIFTTANTLCP